MARHRSLDAALAASLLVALTANQARADDPAAAPAPAALAPNAGGAEPSAAPAPSAAAAAAAATRDDGYVARRVELSRLWLDPPSPDAAFLLAPFAGRSGASLRGWDDGRTLSRPGLEVVPGGYLSPPRVLPTGATGFGLHLSDEFAAGPMLGTNVDQDALLARYPATIAPQLSGGRRKLFNDARATVTGSVLDDRVAYFAEALDTQTKQTYLGSTIAEDGAARRYTLNLAWQPTAYTRVTVGGRYDAIHTENYGLGFFTFPSAGRTRQIDDTTFVARIHHQISPRHEIEATYDVVFGREDTRPLHGLATPGHYNLDTFQAFANAPFNSRGRTLTHRLDAHWSTLIDGLLLPSAAHTVTLGAQGETTAREDDDSRTGGFTFVDYSSAPSGAPVPPSIDPNNRASWTLFSSDRGDELHAKTTSSSVAAYLEDSIAFGSTLRITPGVRYEHFEGAFQNGPSAWRTDTLAPRVGAVWDPDRFTTIFADGGRHYQALMASMFLRASQGAAYSPLEYWDWQDASRPQVPVDPAKDDPSWQRSRSFPANQGNIENVKHPYIDRLAVGITRRIDAIRLKAKLRYEYRHYGDMLALVDTGGAYTDSSFSVTNSPAPKDTVGTKTLQPGSAQSYAITNPSDATREVHTVNLALAEEFTRWLSMRGSLTWTFDRGNLETGGSGISTEWRDPNGKLRSYGNMPVDTWVGRIGTTFRLPFNIRLTADYTFRSGEHYSRVFRIVPQVANQPRFYVYDVDGRGAHTLPPRHMLDAGASVDIASFGGGRLSTWVQSLNLLNLSTVTSVSEKSTFYNSVKSVEWPREIHLGVRYDR